MESYSNRRTKQSRMCTPFFLSDYILHISSVHFVAECQLLEIILLSKIICRLLSRKTLFSADEGLQKLFLGKKSGSSRLAEAVSTDMHMTQKHCLKRNKVKSNPIFPRFWCGGCWQQNTRVSNIFLPFLCQWNASLGHEAPAPNLWELPM